MSTTRGMIVVGLLALTMLANKKAYGQSCMTTGSCVTVIQSGGGDGVFSTANFGNAFHAQTNTGFGVVSYANSSGGTAIAAQSLDNHAVYGKITAANATASVIQGIGTKGPGIEGISSPAWPIAAVHGTSGGTGPGVLGEGGSIANGVGVAGLVTGTGAIGVFGQSLTHDGYGVYGYSGTSGGYAVYAQGAAGGTTGWAVVSDARLKKDVTNLSYGLAETLRLRPVTYKLKEGYKNTQLGLIAQEVQQVVPEVVNSAGGTSGLLSLNYSALVPVVIRAIQDQQKAIDAQQKIIAQQEARLAMLEHARPSMSSMLPYAPGRVGLGLAAGLLPIGFIVAYRRRKA